MENVIQVKELEKVYGELRAVKGISFNVKKGEVFGLLGENGAGKTTTLEMIEGLRKPTSGKIKVLGFDIRDELLEIKEKIGVQLQSSAYYDNLKLIEILNLFGGFYKKKLDSDQLFEMVGLKSKENEFVKNLSGGQKQRFSIIASLINDPEIVFLDEPTTGLDPVARRRTWEIIQKIKEQGKTIILTTHYMEEAEVLCDHIAIMEAGEIVAMDETYRLIEKAKHPYKIEFILDKEKPSLLTELQKLTIQDIDEIKKLPGKELYYELKLTSQEKLNNVVGVLQKNNPVSLTVGRATLEDLFIELTGKNIVSGEEVSND